jgi:hypothetical protein
MDKELPKRPTPNTEIVLPKRAKVLTDNAEPMFTKFKPESALPNLTTP